MSAGLNFVVTNKSSHFIVHVMQLHFMRVSLTCMTVHGIKFCWFKVKNSAVVVACHSLQ